MTDDPFQLRRFGFYSESDIATSRQAYFASDSEGENIIIPGDEPRSPSLERFLAYWTPERIAAAKRGECGR